MFSYLKDRLHQLRAKLRKAHKSGTVWFNSLCASFFLAVPDLVQILPGLAAYVPESDALRYSIVFVNLINIALRFKTSKSLADK